MLFRWEQLRDRPYPPGVAGRVVAGVCLVQFQPELHDVVAKYVARRRMRSATLRVARNCVDTLDEIVPELRGEAAAYFAEYRELLRMAVWLTEAEWADG